jgi:hypothetical protein
MCAFETVDQAQHAGKDYAPIRERIRAYYDWLKELERIVNKAELSRLRDWAGGAASVRKGAGFDFPFSSLRVRFPVLPEVGADARDRLMAPTGFAQACTGFHRESGVDLLPRRKCRFTLIPD